MGEKASVQFQDATDGERSIVIYSQNGVHEFLKRGEDYARHLTEETIQRGRDRTAPVTPLDRLGPETAVIGFIRQETEADRFRNRIRILSGTDGRHWDLETQRPERGNDGQQAKYQPCRRMGYNHGRADDDEYLAGAWHPGAGRAEIPSSPDFSCKQAERIV